VSDILFIAIAVNSSAFILWVVVLVHVALLLGDLKKEQEKTRFDLDMQAYAFAMQLAADNEERRKHLNLVQGLLVGHITGTARQLEALLGADVLRPKLRTVWPLPLRPRTRRRRQACRTHREAA
jgi:hypothetical protein